MSQLRFFLSFIFLFLFFSCSKEKSFVIEGKVDNPVFEGEKVYLVSSDAPITKDVDSTFIRNGCFYFKIPADSQKVKIVRIAPKFPDIVEDLVVIPEHGVIKVNLSQISSGGGTPLNNFMQKWKVKKKRYDSIQWALYVEKRTKELSKAKLDSINEYSKRIKTAFMSDVRNDIGNNLYNGVGLILFKTYIYSLPNDFRDKILSKTGDLYFKKDKEIERMIKQNQK